MKSPKAPVETPQQKAFDVEQRRALNKETQEENRRRKALSRGQLGAVTLLSGLPDNESVVGAPASGVGSTTGGVLDGGGSSSTVPGVAQGSTVQSGGRSGSSGRKSKQR